MATIKLESPEERKDLSVCKEEVDETYEDLTDAGINSATQVEVLALRSQVAYLQDMIEDLRKQLESVVDVLDQSGFDKKADEEIGSEDEGVLDRDLKSKKLKSQEDVCLELSASLSSLVMDPIKLESTFTISGHEENFLTQDEVDEIYELLNLRRSKARLGKVERAQCEDVIRSISKATKLDQGSVCKIISYFGKLTTDRAEDYKELKNTDLIRNTVDPLVDRFFENLPDLASLPPLQLSDSFIDKIDVPPLPAQKVGAN